MIQLRGLGEDWSTMTPDETPSGEDRTAAATYCGKKFGVTSPDFQPCVDFYVGPHIGEYVPSTSPGTKVTTTTTKPSSILSKFGITPNLTTSTTKVTAALKPGVVSSLFSTVAPAGTPWYKTPLGIGAIALGAFFGYRRLKQRQA